MNEEPLIKVGRERIVIIPGMAIRLPPTTLVDELRHLGFTMTEHPNRSLKALGQAFQNAAIPLAELLLDAAPEQKEAFRSIGIDIPDVPKKD